MIIINTNVVLHCLSYDSLLSSSAYGTYNNGVDMHALQIRSHVKMQFSQHSVVYQNMIFEYLTNFGKVYQSLTAVESCYLYLFCYSDTLLLYLFCGH